MVKIKVHGVNVQLNQGDIITDDSLIARMMELCRPLTEIYPRSEDNFMAAQAVVRYGAEVLEPAYLRAAVLEDQPVPA